ncbi:MAG: intraflagellar transport protein [Monoraphidium minutum]|nr:MAG: intraflagellar transport protein [Monoraphidium minutum]
MRAVVAWSETPPEKDGVKNVCYDLCFKPDGSQLVAAVGSRVLVYDAADGELLHALKGHKDAVYSVAYAWNGKRFASGSADKTGEGILKYAHGDSVQALAYNPVTQQLASGTATDLGLWSPEQKAVTKHRVTSKILCLAWTGDGGLLAMGCYDGSVSVRDRAGAEKARFSAGTTPVWSLAWSPQADPLAQPAAQPAQPVLAVGLLDGHLRFFTAGGTQKFKDRLLPGDPLTLAYLGEEYLMVGGTDKSIQMLTKEGVNLASFPGRGSWIWKLAARPNANFIAVACEDGSLAVMQVIFSTVHGLYSDRYAYRDNMTDVIIQHLITEQKVRIKCRDYVKKVAVYRDRVAVQLPSRVIIYELAERDDGAPVDDTGMQYKAAAKISASWECNLLVVASAHLVLCHDKQLQLYDFEGVKQREWSLDAVAGGPAKREALVVGLKNGQVVKVFVDNPFPIPLVHHPSGVRCLDVSPARDRLALVDEASKVVVYDLDTKQITFEGEGANSVAWNADCEGLLCYSGGGALTIKTGDFPAHSQRMNGFVGSKVFCLQHASMQTIDVPQSAVMYLERKDWAGAYRTACLGVTDADWRALALSALQAMEVEVARQAFIRVRDLRAVELADRVAAGLAGGLARRLLEGDIMAWQGRYEEAAALYVQEGRLDKVLDMFTALRQFDAAKKWADEFARSGGRAAGAGGGAAGDLIGRQAEWSEASADYEAAVEMYIKARRYDRAFALISRHGLWDRAPALVRALSKSRDGPLLAAAAGALRKAGQYAAAKEALLKLGDIAGLADLEVAAGRWEDAALLAVGRPELAGRVHLPHAAWLAARDRFDDACAAYRAGGRPDLARGLLRGLADAAAARARFDDAAAAHYRLAVDALQDAPRQGAAGGALDQAAADAAGAAAAARAAAHYEAAELYAAYEVVAAAAAKPFKTADDGTLFGAARFLAARLVSRDAPPPPGVLLSTPLLALAKVAVEFGAFKLARFAYGKLQALALPPDAQADVDLQSLAVRGRPFADAEELVPTCHRCGATNPIVNAQGGDGCVGCGAAFHFSPLTWEALPLVEFELEPGLGDDEAEALIGEGAGDVAGLLGGGGGGGGGGPAGGGGGDSGDGGANVLRLDDGGAGGAGRGALLGGGGAELEETWSAQAVVPRTPIVLDRAALRRLAHGEVLVRRWPPPAAAPSALGAAAGAGAAAAQRARWFRVMDAEADLVVGWCGHFYEADEYEMALLERGHTPFTRERPLMDDDTGAGGGGGGGWGQG